MVIHEIVGHTEQYMTLWACDGNGHANDKILDITQKVEHLCYQKKGAPSSKILVLAMNTRTGRYRLPPGSTMAYDGL